MRLLRGGGMLYDSKIKHKQVILMAKKNHYNTADAYIKFNLLKLNVYALLFRG